MTARNIILNILDTEAISKSDYARELGISRQTLNVRFSKEHMGTDMFRSMIEALGYQVYVTQKPIDGKAKVVYKLDDTEPED